MTAPTVLSRDPGPDGGADAKATTSSPTITHARTLEPPTRS